MISLWNDAEAAGFTCDLGLRVYTSRLLGRDKSLVLHGGGNTSVKTIETTILGDRVEVLWVKGSGWDLETIEPAGFTPLRRAPLLRLARLAKLSDAEMVNALLTERTDAAAPAPSVEAILHAVLPAKFVDHTHADAVVTITNTPGGEARARAIWGDRLVVIPYVMPGFELAREAAARFEREAGPDTVGLLLLNHGIFSFGDTARQSYERMIELVGLAEEHLRSAGAWDLPVAGIDLGAPPPRLETALLRRAIADAAGFPLVLKSERDERTLAFARRPDVAELTQQGPVTPDHVIRTKRRPLLGRDVAGYAAEYREEFARCAARGADPKRMLDPAPRVILDPELGLVTAGRSVKDAAIAAEIYRHTMDIQERGVRLGGFRALPEQDLFDVEYWDLEQAKLARAGAPPVLAGEVALVTGAASGIGRAAVEALLARGAAVVGLDLDPKIAGLWRRPDFLGLTADVTSRADLTRALDATVAAYGGLDLLVLNAGAFAQGSPIAGLSDELFRGQMALHGEANLAFLREAHPLLAIAPRGGRVVLVASKNVAAPGPGAGAYSAAKAAVTQLARVAALEWGKDGIRVNVVHPNAVFDTGVWTEEVLASRAAAYGLTVDEYKRSNVLGTEVTSKDVAEVVAELLGPRFAKTTGAQIPVDGGNDRVI
jgi:rhamnose utilization protein RhaD (predicted bifunctional aldolase and dehydrogenase)/NAD(P)-dependent dehydrogenase (short-subunit alcohol dehydrogenase family)